MVSGDSDFTQACTPGEARLIHGTTSMEGVLEICNNKSDWGTVCSRRFYCEEAMVCCRQVGYDFGNSCLLTLHFLFIYVLIHSLFIVHQLYWS